MALSGLIFLFILSLTGWYPCGSMVVAAIADSYRSSHHFAYSLHTRDEDLAKFGDTINVLGLVCQIDP